MEKIKTAREFTFKSYLLSVDEVETAKATGKVTGKFLTKSDCHYYCEKAVLDYVKANFKDFIENSYTVAIYKICTLETETKPELLVELISVKDGVINIG